MDQPAGPTGTDAAAARRAGVRNTRPARTLSPDTISEPNRTATLATAGGTIPTRYE